MRQAVTVGPREVLLEDAPDPTPGPDAAVVAVETVGLCAADIHFFLGDSVIAHYPHVQGHEFAGRVTRLPEGYRGELRVGERVAVEPLLPCGSCVACRRGRRNCCERLEVIGAHVPGGLAESIALPVDTLHPAGDLEAALAAFVEPVSIGLHAVNRSGLAAGDRAVVFGGGPIGQSVTLAARDRGAEVFVVDRFESRLRLARRLGAADGVVAGPDVTGAVLAWTGGDRPTTVFEATGVAAVLRDAVDLVAHSGVVVAIGISSETVVLPVLPLTQKELSILGSRNNLGAFPDAVRLVRGNRELVRDLITHTFPFEEAADAMAFAADHQQETGKVQIRLGSRA
jgi:L-gulonate 5-dehydrogenase